MSFCKFISISMKKFRKNPIEKKREISQMNFLIQERIIKYSRFRNVCTKKKKKGGDVSKMNRGIIFN